MASRDALRGQQFAQQYAIPKVHQDYAALIADPNVDAVYIANPHRFHHDTIRSCIVQGKPVLCEKPLTVTAAESESLFALAHQQGVFLMEALWTRYLPIWQETKRLIQNDAIGRVTRLESSFGFRIPRDLDDRLLNKSLAGGVLLDMGIYPISLSGFIADQSPQLLQSHVTVGPTGIDEHVDASLLCGDIESHISCSFLTPLDNQFSIIGDKGRIVIRAPFWAATELEITATDGTGTTIQKPFESSGFQYQIQAAMDALSQGRYEEPQNTWHDTLQNQILMDHILENAGIAYNFTTR